MKKSYYTPDEHPSRMESDQIWKAIEPNIPQVVRRSAVIIDWRSFLYGNVAALVLLFSGIGIYSVLNSGSPSSGDRIDVAYEQAMNTLVSVSPELIDSAPDERRARLETTVMNIEDIDRVINEIRDDMLLNGTSEIKQRQLRQMYAMKMDYLKELLLNGEVDL
jgi:predicted lipoprotein